MKVVDLSFLFYFMLLYWIADIGIVFHCKHNNEIHSYIQSLYPKLKILKFKYFKYGTKLVLALSSQPIGHKGTIFSTKIL